MSPHRQGDPIVNESTTVGRRTRRSLQAGGVVAAVACFGTAVATPPIGPLPCASRPSFTAGAAAEAAADFSGTAVVYFHVADLARSLRWYGEVVGLTAVVSRNEEIGWCELASPTKGLTIGLLQSTTVDPDGGETLVFGTADLDATRKRIEAAGGHFTGETEVHPGYVKLATFRDPDGHVLTLSQSLAGDATEAEAAGTAPSRAGVDDR